MSTGVGGVDDEGTPLWAVVRARALYAGAGSSIGEYGTFAGALLRRDAIREDAERRGCEVGLESRPGKCARTLVVHGNRGREEYSIEPIPAGARDLPHSYSVRW